MLYIRTGTVLVFGFVRHNILHNIFPISRPYPKIRTLRHLHCRLPVACFGTSLSLGVDLSTGDGIEKGRYDYNRIDL